MGGGRRCARVTAVALLSLLGAACADAGDPTASSPPTTAPTRLQLGDQTRTSAGVVIRLHGFEFPVRGSDLPEGLGAADVDVCNSAAAAHDADLSLDWFSLELDGGSSVSPSTHFARTPKLEAQQLGRNDCQRAWLTFEVPPGDRPAFFVFAGPPGVRWSVSA